jgi:hypothetical protein
MADTRLCLLSGRESSSNQVSVSYGGPQAEVAPAVSATNLRALPDDFWPDKAAANGPVFAGFFAALLLLLLLLVGCTIRGLPGTAVMLPPLRGVDCDLPLLLLGCVAAALPA